MAGKKGVGGHNRGKGKAIAWLRANVSHAGSACLWWPFSRRQTGYGCLGFEGKVYYAHRLMCEMVNGPAPTPEHEAAHTCGNGMAGCVHPKHLVWKTPSENQLDRRLHGTAVTSIWGNKGKLTPAQREQIIAMKGEKTQLEIAQMFGVHFQTVSRLHKQGIRTDYVFKVFREEDDAELLRLLAEGKRAAEIAELMGRSVGSINARLYKLRRTSKAA